MISQEQLTKNAEQWDQKIRALAKHLAEQQGFDFEKTSNRHYWREKAIIFLSQRVMNKYYWHHLQNHDIDEYDQVPSER